MTLIELDTHVAGLLACESRSRFRRDLISLSQRSGIPQAAGVEICGALAALESGADWHAVKESLRQVNI